MKKHTPAALRAELVNHPYSSNPDYFSRINFFHFSPDRQLASYYWEAPPGIIPLHYEQFDELIFLLEGQLEIRSASGTQSFGPGDVLEISRTDGVLEFRIATTVKAIGYVYPVDEQEYQNIAHLMQGRSY